MERRRIGLNLNGSEVFDTGRGRCVSEHGRDYFDRDQPIEDQGRAAYFLARNAVQFTFCAANVAYMIERGEVLSGAKLVQLHADIVAETPDNWRTKFTLDRLLDEVEQALQRGRDADTRDRSLALFRLWARAATEPAAQVEEEPVLLVGIEGVISSLASFVQGRKFDPAAMAWIARLARLTGAKLVLTAPARLTWRGGPDALWRALQDEGWAADLWHQDWMLPPIDGLNTWQQVDAWLAGRDCMGLLIDSENNRYSGKLPQGMGDHYTYPLRGFEVLDFYAICKRLGISDPELPPPPPAGGTTARPAPTRGAGPSL